MTVAFVGIQKVRFVAAALANAAAAREAMGLRKEADSVGALADMLTEAIEEMGVPVAAPAEL